MRTDELQQIADEMESDLFIIPMSIHELLVLRFDKSKASALSNTHRLVNREANEGDDFLSDNIYVYRRGAGNVEIAE